MEVKTDTSLTGKICAVQMCSTFTVEENLASAKEILQKAACDGVKLAVLPEMFAIFGGRNDKITAAESFGTGQIQDYLSNLSKELNMWIVAGTIPIRSLSDPNRVRAACLVYDHNGHVMARYDKIHMFDVVISDTETYLESATTEPGEEFVVVSTPLGKVGLTVCYDIRFPELFRGLIDRGAEIIVIPTAFTVKTGEAHWELLCRSRAVENFCYVVGACQHGSHANGRKTYGDSMIVDPWGTVVTRLPHGVGYITAPIDLNYLYKIRKDIPALLNRRIVTNLTFGKVPVAVKEEL